MPSPAEKLAKNKTRKPIPAGLGKLQCSLREKRKALELTLYDVADATGLATSSLSEIERGAELTLSSALRLAAFYETPIEELWALED